MSARVDEAAGLVVRACGCWTSVPGEGQYRQHAGTCPLHAAAADLLAVARAVLDDPASEALGDDVLRSLRLSVRRATCEPCRDGAEARVAELRARCASCPD